jgi:4,5-epoxidase
VSYRRGPLGGRGGVGDRVPDRECTTADGKPTRLHAELFPAWVVLAAPGVDVDALVDTARERLGQNVTALFDTDAPRPPRLIRPDGHLAWRGDRPDALRRWFTTRMDT